jgi:hypothetical protein
VGFIERTTQKNVRYEVQNLLELPKSVVFATQRAASAVWQRYFPSESTTMRFFFVGKSFEDNNLGEYDFSNDTFTFAVNTIRQEPKLIALSEQQKFALIGGHEAMHKVQTRQGIVLVESELHNAYADDPNEDAAWREASVVVKQLFPSVHGSFIMNNRIYSFPEKRFF